MKHTMQLTNKDGVTTTLIFCEISGVGQEREQVAWSIKGSDRMRHLEFATEDEARAAYAEVNAALEAWHARNDPPEMLPLDVPKPLTAPSRSDPGKGYFDGMP